MPVFIILAILTDLCPWWLMRLNILCYWPFIYYLCIFCCELLVDIFSLLFYWVVFLFLIDMWEFFKYSGYEPVLVKYVVNIFYSGACLFTSLMVSKSSIFLTVPPLPPSVSHQILPVMSFKYLFCLFSIPFVSALMQALITRGLNCISSNLFTTAYGMAFLKFKFCSYHSYA